MRKTLLTLMAVLLSTFVAKADLPFRNHRYDAFKVNAVKSDNVVFIGNSITNMHEWWEAFGDHKVINRGNSGALSDEIINNLEAILVGKPAKIFLLVGTNDIGSDPQNAPERVARNLRIFLKRCKAESPATKVYVQSILPSTWAPRTLDLEQRTNKLLREVCEANPGVTYVDLWETLKAIPTNKEYSLDQLHLTGKSYRLWCEQIASLVGEGSSCTYPKNADNEFGSYNTSTQRSEAMRVSAFGMSPVKADDILYIGDEMVHGGEWHELLNSPRVKNRGIGWGYSGPTINQVKGSLSAILKGLPENVAPAQIHLYVGTTDANQLVARSTMVEQYRQLLNEVERLAPSSKIFAHSLLPKDRKDDNAILSEFNAMLKQAIAAMGGNITYVDIYTPMLLNGVGNPDYFINNQHGRRIYVSGKGYAKIAQTIATAINDPAITAITDAEANARYATFEARTELANLLNSIELLKPGNVPGELSEAHVAQLRAKLDGAYALLAADNTPNEKFTAKAQELRTLLSATNINLPVSSDDKSTTWYNLYTPLRDNRYTTSKGAGRTVVGEFKSSATDKMWKFELRQDNTYNIINRADGSYLNPVAGYNSAITTISAPPAKGWELSHSNTSGLFIIRSGVVQLNQTGSEHGHALYNWSAGQDGLDRADSGCQFAIVEAEKVVTPNATTDPNMPFATTKLTEDGQFAKDTRWYTLQIAAAGFYLSNPAQGATSIALTNNATKFADADLWCFVGNADTGYKLYNKAAGPSKVLAAPATMSTYDEGGTSFPLLVDEKSIGNKRPYWRFTPSKDLGTDTPSYYIYVNGATNHKLNNRGAKLAFWTRSADAGSSFQIKFGQQQMQLDMTTGTFTEGTGNYRKLWQSNATDPTQISLNAGYNNMTISGSNIVAYTGRYAPQTYSLTAGKGFHIAAYSFDFVNFGGAADYITVEGGDKSFTSSTTKQHLAVNGITDPNTGFVLSGQNKGIVLSNFWVTVQPSVIAPEPQTNIFETRSGQTPYRIPAIAKAKNGHLIAVADYRHSGADIGMATNGRVDLHARISKDNGQTWGDMFPVVEGKGGNNKFWTAFGDPCIVADRESDNVLILSCAGNVSFPNGTRNNHLSVAHFLSTDNGATWSQPIDLESQFYAPLDKSTRGPVRSMFIGSGKIHQSRYVKVDKYYRLYCSTLVKDNTGRQENHCNYVYYSDDFGRNWKLLGDPNTPAIPNGADEPKVEELPDGSVICSSRVTGGRYYNVFSFTNAKEGKGYWGTMALSGSSNKGTVATSNATNGEILLVPAKRKRDNKDVYIALQSVPFGPNRANVGIYYKELDSYADYATATAFAANWDGRFQATRMNSAYSTMCLQADNNIGFLYEESTFGADYTIVYKNYSLERLTDSLYTFNATLDNAPFLSEAAKARVAAVSQTAGEYVGMFDKAKVGELEALLEQFNAAPSMEAYEKFNSYAAENTIPLKMGEVYTFLNRQYPTLYLTPRTSDNAFTGVAEQGETQQFKVVDKGEGKFSLYNLSTQKWVGPTLPIYAYIKMVEEAQAGVYTLTTALDGNCALVCTTPANSTYPALHLSGENNLVSWTSGSEGSHWKIAFVASPSSISPLLTPQAEGKASIYDLQGRRVSQPTRGGVYIVGKQKVIF